MSHKKKTSVPAKKHLKTIFGRKIRGIPSELKLVGILLLMLGTLYVLQLIPQPSPLKLNANPVTGLAIQDSPQESAATTTTTATQPTQQQAQQPKPASTSGGIPIKIVSPQKGSTQSPGFTLSIETSSDVLTCYYLLEDNGNLAWDRRMKPCRTELPVSADHCKTPGKDTCYVYVEAADSNGNVIGSDTAYYSIR